MEKDLIEEAVGFKMSNLKTFPFSHLPIGIQLEVIEESGVEEKMELFNVNSGFRGYFARNGPFGRHVDLIQNLFRPLADRRSAVHQTLEKGRFLLPKLNCNQNKLLFQKIRFCEKFSVKPSYGDWDPLSEGSEEETTNYCASCFANLCMISELRASGFEIPVSLKVLTALQFEVTDWAELSFKYKDFSEVTEFLKNYLVKQLKKCKRVMIIDLDKSEKVLEELSGFQLEEDPKKIQETLAAFNKRDSEDLSKIECYRRKIGDDEEGIVVVALTKAANYYDSSDFDYGDDYYGYNYQADSSLDSDAWRRYRDD